MSLSFWENHEALVLSNDLRYTKDKYKLLAEKLGVEYPSLFGTNTELVLACKHVIQCKSLEPIYMYMPD